MINTPNSGFKIDGRFSGAINLRAAFLLLAVLQYGCGARDDFTGRPANLACSASGNYSDCVLTHKPVGYWPLDDSPGGLAADASGSGLYGAVIPNVDYLQPGLIVNPTKFAMNFNNGGVLLPTTAGLAFSAESSLSIEMWVETTNLDTQLAFSQQRCTPDSIQMWLAGGYPGFRVATDSMVDTRANGVAFVADGGAHHLVGVRDIEANMVRLYVDGILDTEVIDSNRVTGSLVTYPTDTWIGRRTDCGGENPFFGRIDEVAPYTTALTADDVSRHYEAGSSNGMVLPLQ